MFRSKVNVMQLQFKKKRKKYGPSQEFLSNGNLPIKNISSIKMGGVSSDLLVESKSSELIKTLNLSS
jgi:hypothetical protein